MPVITYFLLFVLLVYVLRSRVRRVAEWFISNFAGIKGFNGKILPVFIRVLVRNWYTCLVLLLIWLLLFFTDVGKDTIDLFLSNLKEFDPLYTFLSCLSLFFCVIAMSMVIWILPFYLYSTARIRQIKGRPDEFYLATKVLAFLAMFPFILIANAFLYFSKSTETHKWMIVVVNLISFVVFMLLVRLFKVKLKYFKISDLLKPYFKNPYFFIVVRILISLFLLTLLFLALKYIIPGTEKTLTRLSFFVAIYLFIASAIVFRLLFYTTEETPQKISTTVAQMTSDDNRRYSKYLYRGLFWVLLLVVAYYYVVPSLEPTNALYILLIVFSFYILYLDFCRQIFSNRTGFKKIAAAVGAMLFLVLPFISLKDQYTVPLINKSQTNMLSLRAALEQRRDFIQKNTSDTDNIFIVCAMGGGSRAGYFTAGVLKALDSMNIGLWDRTICYSTVSGGSVGTYNYLKGKVTNEIEDNPDYLRTIYKKNYNSSGIYGLLIGDALETLFGPLITYLKGWISRDPSESHFYDRNHRIRREYDYVLQDALSGQAPATNYFHKTFYPWFKHRAFQADSFENFFLTWQGQVPIHLINTFEVNSGRRTVLSPFPISSNVFANSILPLQDTTFDKKENILNKDILYRDAVNLSELFPLISAASNIGSDKDAQFVDGGYYENYGLTTALEILHYLHDSLDIDQKRLKILLIKNSTQVPPDSGHQTQLFAPLAGVMAAPFTGHANNMLAEAMRALDNHHVDTIVFDAKLKRVPLTRSLTTRHIGAMDDYIRFISIDSMHKEKIVDFIQH